LKATRADVLLARAVMPALLIAGLVVLLVYHFSGTLATTQAQQDAYKGILGLSDGRLAVVFHRDSGIGRPSVAYDGHGLIDYVDSASTISLDGQIHDLWSGDHGYSTDVSRRQIFSTSSGSGWQVVEVTSLGDAGAVTVTYSFVSLPTQGIGPKQVVLFIEHSHRFWLAPTALGMTFGAIVVPEPAPLASTPLVTPQGTLSVVVSGPYARPDSVALDSNDGGASAGGPWATTFSSTYEIDSPPPGKLILLGSETIKFQATAAHQATPVAPPSSHA
jgi:hypothetical protein